MHRKSLLNLIRDCNLRIVEWVYHVQLGFVWHITRWNMMTLKRCQSWMIVLFTYFLAHDQSTLQKFIQTFSREILYLRECLSLRLLKCVHTPIKIYSDFQTFWTWTTCPKMLSQSLDMYFFPTEWWMYMSR